MEEKHQHCFGFCGKQTNHFGQAIAHYCHSISLATFGIYCKASIFGPFSRHQLHLHLNTKTPV